MGGPSQMTNGVEVERWELTPWLAQLCLLGCEWAGGQQALASSGAAGDCGGQGVGGRGSPAVRCLGSMEVRA